MLNPSKTDLDGSFTWLDPNQTSRSANEPVRRDDELEGTAKDDTLEGDKGDEKIEAGAGDDRVDGGNGNDTLKGGKGKDTLNSGEGDDRIEGGGGDDLIKGEGGGDLLEGDNGDDTLKGDKGDDTLNGGEGDDLLVGGNGGDTYVLSTGNDTIQGYKTGDRIVLSDELIEAGITEEDVLIRKTSVDGESATVLSFSKDGLEGTTTVLRAKNKPTIKPYYDGFTFDDGRTTISSTLSINTGRDSDVPQFPSPPTINNVGVETANETVTNIVLEGSSDIDATGWVWKDDGTNFFRGKITGNDRNNILRAHKDNPSGKESSRWKTTINGKHGEDTITGSYGDDKLFGGDDQDEDHFHLSYGEDQIHEFKSSQDKLFSKFPYDRDIKYFNDYAEIKMSGGRGYTKVYGAKKGDIEILDPNNLPEIDIDDTDDSLVTYKPDSLCNGLKVDWLYDNTDDINTYFRINTSTIKDSASDKDQQKFDEKDETGQTKKLSYAILAGKHETNI